MPTLSYMYYSNLWLLQVRKPETPGPPLWQEFAMFCPKICMIIYMNLCNTKGILGSWKLWFSYINEKKVKIKILARFRPIFDFELKEKRSRAQPNQKSFSLSSGSSQLGLDSSLGIGLKLNRSKDIFPSRVMEQPKWIHFHIVSIQQIANKVYHLTKWL